MIGRRIILTLGGILTFLVLLTSVRGAYFPDPVPMTSYDMLFGEVYNGTFGPSSEVAGWDQSGVLRLHGYISTDPSGAFYPLTDFYGPPIGSTDPYDFTWQVYDGSSLWSATIHSTTWTAWAGGGGGGRSYCLNLTRGDEPLRVVPEPATLLVLGLLGSSGLLAGWKNKARRKR